MKMVDQSKDILISDTIGFIDDLPPQLIQAFKTSLQVSLEAHTLLHVIDAADPFMISKFEVVENILVELGVTTPPILVFNKADLLMPEQQDQIRQQFPERQLIFISAATGRNLDELKKLIA
jgi:GTPase